MNHPTPQSYLDNRILTASQPRLHLMLLDGAVRQVRRAESAAAEESWSEFELALAKGMDIVEELVRSVTDRSEPLAENILELYAFLFRELTACRFERDRKKLATLSELLEFERETWRQVCENLEVNATTSAGRRIVPTPATDAFAPGQSFSFEA
jgi:flagellar secretion chaperone FliS